MDVTRQLVRFQLGDVYYPKPKDLLHRLEPLLRNHELQGRVVATSDTRTPDGAYAEVELEGLEQAVIVPISRIRTTTTDDNTSRKGLKNGL